MPMLRTGHIRTHYQDIGDTTKPAILLLHGWGHTWETWSSYIPTLSEHYRLIIPDLPGFGASDSSLEGWNMYQYSVWLTTFLQNLKVDELHAAIGHSFGGKTLGFAWFAYADLLELPTLKQGLFLISSSGIPAPLSPTKRFLSGLTSIVPHRVKRQWLQPVRRLLYERLLNETDYLHATNFQEQTLNAMLRQDIRQEAKHRPDFPVHIAWGAKDTAVPLWMAYEYQKLAPNSQVFALSDADHFVHLTHPIDISRWLEASL